MMNENEDEDFENGRGVQQQRVQPARVNPYNERTPFSFASIMPVVSAGMAVKARQLVSAVMRNEDSLVGLEELVKSDYRSMRRGMVLQILRIQKSSKQSQANMTRKKGGGNVTPVNYDRVLYAMDIHGRAGHNVCVVLLGGGSNDQFWKFDVSMRDGLTTNSKAFFAFISICMLSLHKSLTLYHILAFQNASGPGSLLLVINPKGITNYFTGLPALEVTRGILPIEHNMIIPPKMPVQQADVNFHGVVFDGVRVDVDHLAIFDSNCGSGALCDQQDAYKNGVLRTTCACYTTGSNKRTAGVSVDLSLTQRDGQQIRISNYSSAWFMRTYVANGDLPPGIGAGEIMQSGTFDMTAMDACESIFRYVNDNGGWTATLWVKPGLVRDQATVADSAQYNPAAPTLVEAGSLTYHLVDIRPTEPVTLNLALLNDLKVNIRNHI